MWQTADDMNNPWRPFRTVPINVEQNKVCRNEEGGKLCRPKQTASSGDENWNSVKVINGNGKNVKGQGQYECRAYTRTNFTHSGVMESCRADGFKVNSQERRFDNNGNEHPIKNDIIVQMDSSKHSDWSERRQSEATWCKNGNQWSPFLHGHMDASGNAEQVRFEYRQTVDDGSFYSEKSSYSTDTEDAQEDGYEIVEHVDGDDSVGDTCGGAVVHKTDHVAVDMYNTPPSSPSLHDRYHTAPNSPRSDHDGFCIVDVPNDTDEFGHLEQSQTPLRIRSTIDESSINTNCLERSSYSDVTQVIHHKTRSTHDEHQLNSISNTDKEHGMSTTESTLSETITSCIEEAMANSKICDRDKNDIINFSRMSERYDRSRIPKMELPPFIDVESIQYEADRKTGAVRTVGKGSFGQVFKARFADPALRHLRIVVKEFNEEYTNRQEILDEAKRLLYLGDTGYVPICYGLVYLGDMNNPTYGLVQEYVGSGVTLERVLWDQYDLEIQLWLSIAFQACEGLARFHEKGILLNDIKSNNIILEFFRTMIRIKYIDFGLATDMRGKRYKNTKSLEDFTYLAPEVRKDGCRTNIASDIFSLGFMLDQICSIAGVHELSFMTRLCMDIDPDSRLPVRAAANVIYKHMVAFRYDTTSLSR